MTFIIIYLNCVSTGVQGGGEKYVQAPNMSVIVQHRPMPRYDAPIKN